MKKVKLFLVLVATFVSVSGSLYAQETKVDDYKAFSAGFNLKNMHTWHGFVVQSGPIMATHLEFNDRSQKFTLGLWGGSSFDGKYKELSMYTKYRFSKKFFIEAVSHNNYTKIPDEELHFFSYDKKQGYNFVDLNFGYNPTDKFSIYFATILGGGSGDYEIQTDGSLKDSYTHYLELKHQVWEKDGDKLSLFVAGAYSFITEKTFYTEGKGNIVNVGLVLNKDVKIANYHVPVAFTGMWNPEKQKAVLQLDITVF